MINLEDLDERDSWSWTRVKLTKINPLLLVQKSGKGVGEESSLFGELPAPISPRLIRPTWLPFSKEKKVPAAFCMHVTTAAAAKCARA